MVELGRALGCPSCGTALADLTCPRGCGTRARARQRRTALATLGAGVLMGGVSAVGAAILGSRFAALVGLSLGGYFVCQALAEMRAELSAGHPGALLAERYWRQGGQDDAVAYCLVRYLSEAGGQVLLPMWLPAFLWRYRPADAVAAALRQAVCDAAFPHLLNRGSEMAPRGGGIVDLVAAIANDSPAQVAALERSICEPVAHSVAARAWTHSLWQIAKVLAVVAPRSGLVAERARETLEAVKLGQALHRLRELVPDIEERLVWRDTGAEPDRASVGSPVLGYHPGVLCWFRRAGYGDVGPGGCVALARGEDVRLLYYGRSHAVIITTSRIVAVRLPAGPGSKVRETSLAAIEKALIGGQSGAVWLAAAGCYYKIEVPDHEVLWSFLPAGLAVDDAGSRWNGRHLPDRRTVIE